MHLDTYGQNDLWGFKFSIRMEKTGDFMCDMIVVVRWADLTFSETTDVLEFSHTVI